MRGAITAKNWDLVCSFDGTAWLDFLNFLQVFVGYQANFPWFYEILKETSMH